MTIERSSFLLCPPLHFFIHITGPYKVDYPLSYFFSISSRPCFEEPPFRVISPPANNACEAECPDLVSTFEHSSALSSIIICMVMKSSLSLLQVSTCLINLFRPFPIQSSFSFSWMFSLLNQILRRLMSLPNVESFILTSHFMLSEVLVFIRRPYLRSFSVFVTSRLGAFVARPCITCTAT